MKAIKKVSMVDQVVDRLVTYIKSDSIKINDKLPTEKQLCEMLNVGRGTLREAIRVLQTKGYLEFKPGMGSYVVRKDEIGPADLAKWFRENEVEIKDCIEARRAIEPFAISLAVQRCTEEDIKSLEDIQLRTITAATHRDSDALAILDEQFHNAIVNASKNNILIQINKTITYSLIPFRSKTFKFEKNIKNLISAHQKILDALKERSVENATTALIDHLKLINVDLESSKYPSEK